MNLDIARSGRWAGPKTVKKRMVHLADEIVERREAKGGALDWPAGMDVDIAFEPEDYPSDVWAEASEQWNGMSPAQRDEMTRRLEADFEGVVQLIKEVGLMGEDIFSLDKVPTKVEMKRIYVRGCAPCGCNVDSLLGKQHEP